MHKIIKVNKHKHSHNILRAPVAIFKAAFLAIKANPLMLVVKARRAKKTKSKIIFKKIIFLVLD